jgi:hypothetical protein
MNFRSLDPRDERKGLSGAGAQDRAVWAKFFDPVTGLREDAVRAEYARLWADVDTPVQPEQSLEEEAGRLLEGRSLDTLMGLWAQKQPRQPRKPHAASVPTRVYDRDALVVAIARLRADWRCEVPDCTTELFEDASGVRYVEVHHIDMLGQGGEDTPENVVCLCPGHHREAHFGKNAEPLAQLLRQVRGRE